MEKARAIEHFLYYLNRHPALENIVHPNLLLGHTANYTAITEQIIELAAPYDHYHFQTLRLDQAPTQSVAEAIHRSDLYLFFYDSSTLSPPRPQGPDFIQGLREVMAHNWKKSVLFKDYGHFFYDTFSISPRRIHELNAALIQQLSQAHSLTFQDAFQSDLQLPLDSIKKWTNINGVGNFDLAPGEIATHSEAINGRVNFVGTFLSTIPFARKYGVLLTPLELWINNSSITRIATLVPGLESDFTNYLSANPSNRRIEELGIGTNEGIKALYGRNAGFEERHCGLHLGLGGGAKGSHHLDLIFSSGVLALDGKTIFDGQFAF